MQNFKNPKRTAKFDQNLEEVSRILIEGNNLYAFGSKGVHIIDISSDEMK
jgi:hypothetical protein